MLEYKKSILYIDLDPSSLSNCDAFIKNASKVVCIVDENTSLLAKEYLSTISNEAFCYFETPSGESTKSWEWVQKLVTFLLSENVDRNGILIAFGGGVISDLTGFAASIYKRGIPWIAIPTTLMAQIDAAIGGKTAINTKEGKNTIGTFYLPTFTIIDKTLIHSLPESEIYSGLGEWVKYYWISKFKFQNIPKNGSEIDIYGIKNCIEVKLDYVLNDFKDQGIRAALNAGHTIGHAIESYSHFLENPISHGQAVLWGLLIESRIALSLNILTSDYLKEIEKSIFNLLLPFHGFALNEKIIQLLLNDKKSKNEMIYMALLTNGGQCEPKVAVSLALIEKNWIWQ